MASFLNLFLQADPFAFWMAQELEDRHCLSIQGLLHMINGLLKRKLSISARLLVLGGIDHLKRRTLLSPPRYLTSS
jgi:hypothetical protein